MFVHSAVSAAVAGVLLAGASASSGQATQPVDPVDRYVTFVDAGNGITANIVRGAGSMTLTTPTPFVWDPWFRAMAKDRRISPDRSGLGEGWRVDTMFVNVRGGAHFYFPEIGSMFAMDSTTRTGLIGYPGDDIRADWGPGTVPAREGVPERAYQFTLQHLDTGEMKYFSWEGDLIAAIQVDGSRRDWVFDEVVPNRLLALVDERGAMSRLDWTSEPGAVVITEPDGGWIRLLMDGGRLEQVVTEDARSMFGFDEWEPDPALYAWIGTNVGTDPGAEEWTSVAFNWSPNHPGDVQRVQRNGELVFVARGNHTRSSAED